MARWLYVTMVIFVMVANTAGEDECGGNSESAALSLSPCIQAGENANAPVSKPCCEAVRKHASDPACLCALMLSRTAQAVGIKPAAAVSIPKRCQFSDRPVGYKCGAYTVP